MQGGLQRGSAGHYCFEVTRSLSLGCCANCGGRRTLLVPSKHTRRANPLSISGNPLNPLPRPLRSLRLYFQPIDLMQLRPKPVVVVSIFLFAAAAISILVGTALLLRGPLLERFSQLNEPGMAVFQRLDGWAVVLMFALGAGTCWAAVGLLRRRKWAWWFAVVLFTMNACGDLASFFVTRDAVRSISGVLISAAFLLVLSRRDVQLFFGKAQ
jgi:hypothetical protein